MQEIKNFPDSEMVHNLRSGKRMDETIKAIYRNCFDSLSWYVMNNSGSRQDAEDIFQDVVVNFIDIVQKDKFRGESSIRTFLFSLNRHLWLNELKRKGRALAREEKYEKEQDKQQGGIGQDLIGKEDSAQLMELMDRLGETCKKILVLFYYENLSIKEILDSLDYENEQVVRNKKYKCVNNWNNWNN